MPRGMDAGVPHTQDDYAEWDTIRSLNNDVPTSSSNSVPLKVFITVVTSLSTSSATVPGSTNGEFNRRSPRRLTLANLQTMNNQTIEGPLDISLPAGTSVTIQQQPPPSYGNSQQQTNYPSAHTTTYLAPQPQQQQKPSCVTESYVYQPFGNTQEFGHYPEHTAPQIVNLGCNQQFPTTPNMNWNQSNPGPMRTQNIAWNNRYFPYDTTWGTAEYSAANQNHKNTNGNRNNGQGNQNKNTMTYDRKNHECLRYGVSFVSLLREWNTTMQHGNSGLTSEEWKTIKGFLMNGHKDVEDRLKKCKYNKEEDGDTALQKYRKRQGNYGAIIHKLMVDLRICFGNSLIPDPRSMQLHEEEKKIMGFTSGGLKAYPLEDDFSLFVKYLPPSYPTLAKWLEFMDDLKKSRVGVNYHVRDTNTHEYGTPEYY